MGLSLFVVATRTAMIAHRRACPEPVSATSLGPFVDNTDADWRCAFSCRGEIDRHIETVIKTRSESASVAPTEVSKGLSPRRVGGITGGVVGPTQWGSLHRKFQFDGLGDVGTKGERQGATFLMYTGDDQIQIV